MNLLYLRIALSKKTYNSGIWDSPSLSERVDTSFTERALRQTVIYLATYLAQAFVEKW